jgi:undecaprenyl-diphosphatase
LSGISLRRFDTRRALSQDGGKVSLLVAIILGLVEGLTEFLPVSSTGHLVLVSHWLGSSDEGAKSFDIVIQLGAILAVIVHYRALFAARLRGLVAREPEALRLFSALAVAFIPAALVGLLLGKTIKRLLFGPLPVAAALLVGGVVMIVVERSRKARQITGETGVEHVTWQRALWIGIGQCFSLWPGMSRSMSTIVAGQLTGLSTPTAAEFSFLLSVPTLGAATLYEGFKARHALMQGVGGSELAVGLVVSFVVAWVVIAAFIRYLGKRGLAPFGWYRIALAALVFVLARG